MYRSMFRHLWAPFHVGLITPQGTIHFVRTGASVIGSGTTATGHVDYFYGQDGVAYAVAIAPGANLFNTFAGNWHLGMVWCCVLCEHRLGGHREGASQKLVRLPGVMGHPMRSGRVVCTGSPGDVAQYQRKLFCPDRIVALCQS